MFSSGGNFEQVSAGDLDAHVGAWNGGACIYGSCSEITLSYRRASLRALLVTQVSSGCGIMLMRLEQDDEMLLYNIYRGYSNVFVK